MRAARSAVRPRWSLSRRRLHVTGLDLAGLALMAGAVVWTFGARWASGGKAAPIAGLILASGAALWAGRIVASMNRLVVPALVVSAAAVLWLSSPRGVLSSAPLAGPFHYANAKGAFFVLASVAGLMLAAGSPRPVVRALGVGASIAFAAVPIATGVITSSVLVVGAWVAGILAARGAHAARSVVRGAGALFVAALAITVLLAATYSSKGAASLVGRVADPPLTEHRVALWHDAWRLMTEAPESGVGPGRFQQFSSIARADPADDRWAHNEFLQQGAEQGVLGPLLLAALFIWGLVRLQARRGIDVFTTLAGLALAGLGIHATVDYVLHFAALPLTAAALAGAGIARTASKGFLGEASAS